jgi:hypothetical protein
VYEHDADGNTLQGDLDELKSLVREGRSIQVGIRQLFGLAGSIDFDLLKQVHDAGSGSSSAVSGASGPDLFWTFASGLGSTEGLSGSSPSFTLVLNGGAGTGLTSSSGAGPAGAAGTMITVK